MPASIICVLVLFALAASHFCFTNARLASTKAFSSNDTNNNQPPSNPIRFPILRVSRFLGLDRGENYTSTSDNGYKGTSLTLFQHSYLAEVKLGSRRVPAHLLLDTGSSLIWWQCFPCETCYTQNDPKFLPSQSSSYYDVSCSGPMEVDCHRRESFIRGCINGYKKNCGYIIHYADGDMSQGRIGKEDLYSVDGSFVGRLSFGCADYNTGEHFGGGYAGILGFGFGRYSFPSQLGVSRYSICLVSSDNPSKEAFLYLGSSPPPTGDGRGAITVPLYRNNHNLGAHYLRLSGIEIGKRTVNINKEKWEVDSNGNYGVMVDTGSAVTSFPPDEYATFRDTFRAEFDEYESFMVKDPSNSLDTCYDFYAYATDYFDELPDIKLYFDDPMTEESRALMLSWKQVMIEVHRTNTRVRYCLAFRAHSTNSWNVTKIGTYQLQGTRLSYDTAKMTLTFDPHEC